MSYNAIQKTIPQYVDSDGNPYVGAVLKAYEAGTTTPLSLAIASDGATLVSSVELDSGGYPSVSGNRVLLYANQDFKLALYPDQTAADANNGAIWMVDSISGLTSNYEGSKISNVGEGTERGDAVNIDQVQDSKLFHLGTTGGSADAYTLSPTPAITAYVNTQSFSFKAHASNTTATPYIQISDISSPSTTATVVKLSTNGTETALVAGDIKENKFYIIQRNSANNKWILQNPENAYVKSLIIDENVGTGLYGGPVKLSNNSTDGDHDIDFSAGLMVFDDGTGQASVPAITKQIDGAWTAGSGLGGLDTGTVAANTWYYGFSIYNPTTKTAGAILSASRTSPTLPTGYTKKQYRGAVRTDGSGNIRQGNFTYNPDGSYRFFYKDDIVDLSTAATSTTRTAATLTVPRDSIAICYFDGDEIAFFEYHETDRATTSDEFAAGQQAFNINLKVNSNSEIFYKARYNLEDLYILTKGFIDSTI